MSDIKQIANDLAEANRADIILINASMDRGVETKFIEKCSKLCLRENAIVVIVTSGGDADVAYRIARCLQQRYQKITALISGQCKSAGTLLAMGAHELAFSDHGELGPLDVQLRKIDMSEAGTLFKNVRPLTAGERELCDSLGHLARQPSVRSEHVYYMSDPPAAAGEANKDDAEQTGQGRPAGQEQGAEGTAEQAASAPQAGETTAEVVRLPTGTERSG